MLHKKTQALFPEAKQHMVLNIFRERGLKYNGFYTVSFKGQINQVAKNLCDKGYIEEEFSLTQAGEEYFRGKDREL